uniref:Remorin C-terminal domain-containing protein n=1 Tax=Aegilops tauschii subsp. strangulata TaxID=200361 RepID=A0A453P606_AEGTS
LLSIYSICYVATSPRGILCASTDRLMFWNFTSVQEELEKKKAKYAEKMKNKKAIAHREAEEKRAMVVARRGEEVLKAEEMAAKYRATGLAPKKLLGCFGA